MDQTVYDLDDIKLIVSVKDCKYSVMICCHDTCETTAWRTFTDIMDPYFAGIMSKFCHDKTRSKLIYDLYHKLAYRDSNAANIDTVIRFFGPFYANEEFKYSLIDSEYCVKIYKDKSVLVQSFYIVQTNSKIEVYCNYNHYYLYDNALSVLERDVELSLTDDESELRINIYNAYWSTLVSMIIETLIKMQLFPEPLCNIIKNYLA
jgi:hypothetical protein